MKKDRKAGNHDPVCKWAHRDCICISCRHDDQFCCEFHGKACNGGCEKFEPDQEKKPQGAAP